MVKKIHVLCKTGETVVFDSGMQGKIISILEVSGIPHAKVMLLTPVIIACCNLGFNDNGYWTATSLDATVVVE